MRIPCSFVGALALVTGILASGCSTSISLQTKVRDVQDNVVQNDTADWAGGKIKIQSDGVGVSINGGVRVIADPNATRVTATARLVAMVLPDDKANGDLSIADAQATFTISHSGNDIVVSCSHGQTHGSSNSGESGCELLTVTIPVGTAAEKLDLTVLSGNGGMNLQLGSAILSNLGTNATSGDTVAVLPATQGANISLVSEQGNDIDATMPSGWSADSVILQADTDKIKNSFTLTSSGGYGTAGAGLQSLKLTSKEFAGSTGEITLH